MPLAAYPRGWEPNGREPTDRRFHLSTDRIDMTEESLYAVLQRLDLRERQIKAMHRISAALTSKNALDTLLRETLHVSLETVDAEAGSILLYDKERDKLVFRYVIGKTELIGQVIDRNDRVAKAAAVFRTGVSQLIEDTRTDVHNTSFDRATGFQTKNILTVPLKKPGGDPIGVMQALNQRRGHFNVEDQELLEIVSGLASTYIVNASLAEEAQLAAVARAVGDLSHDIKNALTPIVTGLETLTILVDSMYAEMDTTLTQLEAENPEQVARLWNAASFFRELYPEMESGILDGCTDIREMVAEISDYLKGTQSIHLQQDSIKKVIEERLARLRVLARRYRVTLSTEEVEDIPPFRFDRRLLGRAIYNLVNNALGAMDDAVKKGLLELRDFHVTVRAKIVQAGTFPEGNYCLIEVQDDGPGIPPRVKEVLFTPQAISTTPGGTGIGTRFVKDVAVQHRGLVGVESELGHGALFWIKLPLTQE